MENYDSKRLKGLITFTGLMSMSLASLIGLLVQITVQQGNSITSLLFFIAGIVATTISYIIAVVGGVPLPGPKKLEALYGFPFPDPAREIRMKQHVRIACFMAIMFVSQIALFILARGYEGPNISSVLYFVAGIAGSTISYAIIVSGGVLPPGPKGWEQINRTGK
jgi:hypothetical protein